MNRMKVLAGCGSGQFTVLWIGNHDSALNWRIQRDGLVTGALNEACTLVAHAADRTTALGEAIAIVEQLVAGLRVGTARTPADDPS